MSLLLPGLETPTLPILLCGGASGFFRGGSVWVDGGKVGWVVVENIVVVS